MKTIIVPYRDRPDHLQAFVEHQLMTFGAAIPIAVIEQCGAKPFNRGRLLNIGFLEFSAAYYIMHDVDMLPDPRYWYDANPFADVIQFAKSDIQKVDYLGGVTMYKNSAFRAAGGYHNDYFHRGEDNEMRFNLNRLGIKVINNFMQFKTLQHARPAKEFDTEIWKKAQQKRSHQYQIDNCVYEILGRDQINDFTTLLRVRF